MKIAIISDTHDNLTTLNQALDWIGKEKIEMLIHCGDLENQETLDLITEKFPNRVHLVLGNADDSNLTPKPNVKIWQNQGEIVALNKKIAFAHFPEKAMELAEKSTLDLVFYGHTHKPWKEKIGNCRLVNPGTLAGMFYKATFAVYDTTSGKLELKILENL